MEGGEAADGEGGRGRLDGVSCERWEMLRGQIYGEGDAGGEGLVGRDVEGGRDGGEGVWGGGLMFVR